MDIFKINGPLIQKLRDEMGWTRDDLCDKSGVPIGTIQDIETGKSRGPSFENIKKLLKALPNYSNNLKKSELIGEIVMAIPALDQKQLRSVLESIEALPPSSSLNSEATSTD